MTEPRLGAIILAAGLSSRMQAFKPLLKICGKTFIEHAVTLFHQCGVEQIITVVGHRAEQLIPVLTSTSSTYVLNANARDGMFSSVQQGVASRNPAWEGFFLLPVDIPLVRPETIRALTEAFDNNPSALVCYPRNRSGRGHPPLLNSRIADSVLAYSGQHGLRGLLRSYEDRALDVPVDDPFIRMDADSRQDLAELRSRYRCDNR